jgi:hypothetical protein
MDYPSGSDDEDSDFVLEQPEETEENILTWNYHCQIVTYHL